MKPSELIVIINLLGPWVRKRMLSSSGFNTRTLTLTEQLTLECPLLQPRNNITLITSHSHHPMPRYLTRSPTNNNTSSVITMMLQM